MLDDLVDRYGEGAIVTVSPYVLDSGETFRWSVQIDGKEVSDIDVRVDEDPETGDQMVMRLFHADEELEIERWSKRGFRTVRVASYVACASFSDDAAPRQALVSINGAGLANAPRP
jgi:hypothetical protein